MSSLWVYRVLTWSVLLLGLAVAAVVLSLRYWVLPNVDSYRDKIARTISHVANQQITISRISGNWDGMRPELVLEGVTVFDASGRPALELSRVDNTLSWLSLAVLEPRFHSLEIHQPALDVRRDARGVIAVAGIELKEEGGGFVDWLLRQREFAVRDANISWHDGLRGAPSLELKRVNLVVRNSGGRHRFGLKAVPPPHLASPIDLRGNLRGETVSALEAWGGDLFVQVDYADISAWRTWVHFPVEFPKGAGALRMWATLDGPQVTQLTTDLRLTGVRARLAADLPELDLAELSGRVKWQVSPDRIELSTAKLGFRTGQGLALPPADFLLRLRIGEDENVLAGEMYANALDMEPLVLIADRLPLNPDLRKRLVEVSPKGALYDLNFRWSGDWPDLSQYRLRGRFQNLAMNHIGAIPGFSGVSGSVDGNEQTGSLHFNSTGARLDMPQVFREPLPFDTLTAQLAWGRRGSDYELRLDKVSFSNAHLSGTVFGHYQTAAGAAGTIDLTGNLTRADGRFVGRYMPLVVGKGAREWIDRAFLAGKSDDVSLRLKGKLTDFPFAGNRAGVFHVLAKVTGGVLDYAPGWPKIENIAGELAFRGERMDVNVKQATLLGARLSEVTASIPDLTLHDEVLRVSGDAEGPTSEFLEFIARTPVVDMIDRFTEGMQAQGEGRLALRLEIPLRAREKSKVSGAYQFIDNHIVANAALPPLEHVNGGLDFTESSVRISSATGVFLGGPVSVSAATGRDTTVGMNIQGRVNMDSLRQQAGSPAWSHQLRGAADWKGAIVLRNKVADLTIESDLKGIASDLPAPFVKTVEEVMPLRIERRTTGPQQERLSLAYGKVVSAQLVRRIEGSRTIVSRGIISFGAPAAEPVRDGLWLSGNLKSLDIDRWRALSGGSPGTPFPTPTVDVKIGELTALGRKFHDFAVSGASRGDEWQSRVTAREFDGNLTWRGQGHGRLTVRMRRFSFPRESDAGSAGATAQPAAPERKMDWPALDVFAEQFQFRDKALGALELLAAPSDREWRIERLRVVNSDGTLNADGVWQTEVAQPRTQINFRLEVSDIGKFLARLGYPEGVRRGTSKLEGALQWNGGPQAFDYPLLSGNFVVEAAKGQFAKLEPGIGKLLGILSLQSLPRRITLDFRDIFSEGFAF
ncbi:MAG: YhdP family protein, partial [Betaproteobacteria bacterium]|nr:YhdP family protein [Betaproteobacteria bacterium]